VFVHSKREDIRAGGFFYTGDVLFKKRPLYTKQIFSLRAYNTKIAFVKEKKTKQYISIAVLLQRIGKLPTRFGVNIK